MLSIFYITMPIFLIIVFGHILLRLEVIDSNFVDSINRLIGTIGIPLVIFYSVSTSSFLEAFSMYHVLVMYSSIVVITALSFIMSALFRWNMATAAAFVNNNFRSNFSFVGLPIVLNAYGEAGLQIAGIFMAFGVPIVSFIAIMSYSFVKKGKHDMKKIALSILLNPILVACILGIITSLAPVSLPVIMVSTLKLLNNMVLPLALLAMGASINLSALKGSISPIVIGTVMKLICMPLLVMVSLRGLGYVDDTTTKVLITLTATPAATVNYIFAAHMGGNKDLASAGVILSTALSAFTLTGWLYILGV